MYLGDLLSKRISLKPTQTIHKEGSKEYDGNEALFFVTINKKQFLTRFVTYISDEDLAGLNKRNTSQGNEEKKYVIIGRNKKTRKSSIKDFSIKAAPKI